MACLGGGLGSWKWVWDEVGGGVKWLWGGQGVGRAESEKPEHLALLNKACPQGKPKSEWLGYYQRLPYLGKENIQLQPILVILFHLRGRKKLNVCEVQGPEAQAHSETETQSQDYRTLPLLSPSTHHHHITKDLFIAVPFTQYILSGYQENYKTYRKAEKHNV